MRLAKKLVIKSVKPFALVAKREEIISVRCINNSPMADRLVNLVKEGIFIAVTFHVPVVCADH
jgi:hypothetical protein